MEGKKIKVLLGVDRNQELVFGEFGITYRNGYPEFFASFDTVRPFMICNGSELENLGAS